MSATAERETMKYLWQFAIQIKRLTFFVGSIVLIFLLYETLLPNVWQRQHILISLLVLWALTAYIVLPRIHRLLSRLYVPDNFIGRTRTADGLLSDPVNIALNGRQRDLIAAMEAAGWQLAEPISLKSSWNMIKSVVFKKSYPTAPVSDAFLFGQRHDFAFQREVQGNPQKRHHVRFWRTPRGWYLPGGYKVQWVGAATYDEAVGLSLFTFQFTHRISSEVDEERDYLVQTLMRAGQLKNKKHIKHFFPTYHTRNGFGNRYITDGALVIADLAKKG